MISPAALESLRASVEKGRLYSTVPVSLDPLLEGVRVALLPLSRKLLGFSLVHRTQTFIGINRQLGRLQRRRVLAHELGHILCKHPSAVHCMSHDSWLAERLEAEAEAAGAFLLVPWPLPPEAQGLDLRQLCSLLEVPPETVQLRARLFASHGL